MNSNIGAFQCSSRVQFVRESAPLLECPCSSAPASLVQDPMVTRGVVKSVAASQYMDMALDVV